MFGYEEEQQEKIDFLMRKLSRYKSDSVIDDQTTHFWHLQLQFMQMRPIELKSLLGALTNSGLYKENKHSDKFWKKVSSEYSQEDRDCLATHLALQLSGLA